MARTRRRATQEVTVWNCCGCGMGVMLVRTTPHCVTCDRAMCGFCQIYKQSVNTRERRRRRSVTQGTAPILRSEQLQQVNMTSFTAPTEQSKHVLTQSPAYKHSFIDNDRPHQPLGLGYKAKHVLLLHYLNMTGLKGTVKIAASTKDCGVTTHASISPKSDDEEQSSPGEFTPGSESSESWQELDDEEDLATKCDTIAYGLSDAFEELFRTWLGRIRDHNGGPRPSSASGPARNATDGRKRSEPKRKRIDNSDEQDDDASPEKSGGAMKKRRKTMPLDTQLACPYFKKDPRRHRACCGYGGQKLSYVKQHLNRNHTISLYCPVCLVYFPEERLRDEHIIARTCNRLDNQQTPEGVTMEQRLWLSRRGPAHLSEEQHWYRIFQHLFPGHPLPRSAYNDMTFSEEFLDFRDFISEPTGLDLLLARVRGNPSWTAEHETLFGPDIGQGLGQLYWLWAAARQGESQRAFAVENPMYESQYESQDTLSPSLGEVVHRPGLQPGQEPVTHRENRALPTPMPTEEGERAPRSGRTSIVAEQSQVVHDAPRPDAVAISTGSEQEYQKLDDGESPDEGGQTSSIRLTRIRYSRPRTSLINLDQPESEPMELPVLGDDTQGATTLGDFDLGYLSDGLGESEIWNLPSVFEMDEAEYSLEHLGASREDDILSNVVEPLTDTTAMMDEQALAMVTGLDDCIVAPQPPK